MIYNPYQSTVPTIVDLHGYSLESAKREIDREINHTFIQETEDRRIDFITGWGTILHARLREYIQEHPLVKEIEVRGPAIRVHLEGI